MSILQRCPPTELVIDDIIGSDQFPDDLKVYKKSWDGYHCQRRKWEGLGFCHWLFWSDHSVFQFPIREMIKSILVDVEGQGDFLVQCWKVPSLYLGFDSTNIITARHQPFGLNSTNIALYAYASMSQFYESDATSKQHFGLVNRVFRSGQAECTTKRRAYPMPPRAAAVDCNITASLAFRLLNSVMEIVTLSDRPTNELYGIFRQIVSKHAVDPSSRECVHLIEQNDKREEALEEIKKSLEEVCRIYDMPWAGTWIPCRICNALFHIHRVIITQGRSYLPLIFSWCRIKKGQGAVGKAFLYNKLKFCKNVSRVSKSDRLYPLLPRNGRLTSCFAVPLRRRSSSLNEEDDVYVVEVFLPPNYVEFGDWKTTAFSLLSIMRQHLKSVSIESGGEIGADLPIDDKHVENGGETVQLDSPNQEKEKNATAHAENNDKSCTEERNTTIMFSQQKVQRRNAGIPISYEIIQQHIDIGMKLEDAADSIGVSRSTLKRACREYGILWWQSRKRKNKDTCSVPKKTLQCAAVEKQIGETSEAPISDQSGKQHMETNISRELHEQGITSEAPISHQSGKQHTETNISRKLHEQGITSEAPISDPSGKPHTNTNISRELHEQGISSVTIKAKFGVEDFIKFKLPVTSGMREFQHQVEKRLHLKDGTYSIRYQDDDNDSILVVCDEDLQDYICNSRAMGRNTITVSLQSITNFPNYPF